MKSLSQPSQPLQLILPAAAAAPDLPESAPTQLFSFKEKENIHLSCEVTVTEVVTVVDIIKSKYFVTILNFLLNLKTGNLLNLKFKTFQ